LIFLVGVFYIATATFFTGTGFRVLSAGKIVAIYFGLVLFTTLLGILARSIKIGQLASFDWIIKMLGIAIISVNIYGGICTIFILGVYPL